MPRPTRRPARTKPAPAAAAVATAPAEVRETRVHRGHRRTKVGRVVSAKMPKTVIVEVERLRKHPLYKKVIKVRTKFASHDATGEVKAGDLVRIQESRPFSATKRWQVIEVLSRIGEAYAAAPEAEDIEVDIHAGDLRVEIFRARGPGGQSVNTTDSAVRITHVPTGVNVSGQDEKSQLQNKEKAMRVLRARLFELEQAKQDEERGAARRSMVGSGDRSQKIRTYNFQQNRVSDHRIGLTSHRLTEVMEGDLDEFTEALAAEDRRKQLAAAGGE